MTLCLYTFQPRKFAIFMQQTKIIPNNPFEYDQYDFTKILGYQKY